MRLIKLKTRSVCYYAIFLVNQRDFSYCRFTIHLSRHRTLKRRCYDIARKCFRYSQWAKTPKRQWVSN